MALLRCINVTVLLMVLLVDLSECQTLCQCGVFVPSMFPGLSNLDPLQYVEEDGSSESCDLASCQDYCASVSANFDFDLSMDYPQTSTPTGQVYCDQVEALWPGLSIDEGQVVRARTPDESCSFFLWGTTNVYTSPTQLCCIDGVWCGKA